MKSFSVFPVWLKYGGFSLVELMVALLIGTVLVLGIMELFIGTLRADRTSTELARVQENGRIAMELITREVRRAGYQGCSDASTFNQVDSVTYPDNALQSTAENSLTVHYAVASGGIVAFPATTCAPMGATGQTLFAYRSTFSNCGLNLCINSTDSGGNQSLVNKTQITNLRFALFTGSLLTWKTRAQMLNTDWSKVKQVEISLTMSAPDDLGFQARTITSVVRLRNRI